MKKFRILIMLLILVLPGSVNALTGNISISCTPNEVKKGGTFKCTVSGSSSPSSITELKAKVTLSEGLSFVTYTEGKEIYLKLLDGWQGDTDLGGNREDPNGNYIDVHIDDPTDTNFNVAEFTVKVADNIDADSVSVGLSNVEYWPPSGSSASITSASTTVKISSGSSEPEEPKTSYLKSFSVTSGGVLMGSFDKTKETIGISLIDSDTTKFSISAVAENENDKIVATNYKGDSIALDNVTFNADSGKTEMSINITVGSGDTAMRYVVLVSRPLPPSVGQPTLASLIVGGNNINLSDGKEDYTITLSNNIISSYQVNATLSDSKNFSFSEYTLSLLDTDMSGEKTLQIEVVPKDSSSGYGSKTYTVTVKKVNSTQKPSSTKTGNSSNIYKNPDTGRSSAIVVGILLIVSFGASLYFYKKNMSEYN